jgi:hypothetical protein
MSQSEISNVTWSPRGIRVVYTNSKVVHLSADDIYPLAVDTNPTAGPVADRLSNVIPLSKAG